MAHDQAFVDVSAMDFTSLLSRAKESVAAGSQLAVDDVSLFIKVAESLALLHQKVEKGEIRNRRLMKLLGILPKSEKSAKSLEEMDAAAEAERLAQAIGEGLELEDFEESDASEEKKPEKNRSKHGRRNAKDFKDAEVIQHPMNDIASGCVCDDCGRGKLYKFEPSTFVRIKGQLPLQGTVHIRSQMRCNHCQKVYKAELPQEVIDDGAVGQRFGYSAIAMVALLKYAYAFPWHRLSDMQAMLGTKVSPSTLWDLMERLSNDLKPLFEQLKVQAASAKHYNLDDTGNRIINIDPVLKKRRNSEKEQLRSGINTSGLIAKTQDDHDIILFKTGIGHAGEFFDEILELRPNDAGMYVYMCDALSSNDPTVRKDQGQKSLCNAHARRQFDEIKEKYPTESDRVLETYRQVYKVDKDCRTEGLSPTERLKQHQSKSLPLMQDMLSWSQGLLDRREVEPNCALGEAITYLLKHQTQLLAFTRIEGAQLDNNHMERNLRVIVLGRKNHMHFKERIGAAVADTITSLCMTAEYAGINCFEYLIAIQRHSKEVKASPMHFLPWNYQQKIESIAKAKSEKSTA